MGKLTEKEQKKLAAEYLPMAAWHAVRFSKKPGCPQDLQDRDEAVQEASIGLMNAVKTWDSERGACLGTHIWRCVNTRLWDRARLHSNQGKRPIAGVSGDDVSRDPIAGVICGLPEPPEQVVAKEKAEILRSAFDKLPDRLKEIMGRIYGINRSTQESQTQIARSFGLSDERVSQLHRKAIGLMRKELESVPEIID